MYTVYACIWRQYAARKTFIHDCVHNTARYTAWVYIVYNLNIKETNVHCSIRSVLIKNPPLKDSVHVMWAEVNNLSGCCAVIWWTYVWHHSCFNHVFVNAWSADQSASSTRTIHFLMYYLPQYFGRGNFCIWLVLSQVLAALERLLWRIWCSGTT